MGKIILQKPELKLLTRLESEKEKKIIIMVNSSRYLLDYVIVVFEEYGYRLVVNRSGEIITDNTYETLGGAKVAFLKFKHLMAFFDADRPKWSHAYVPDKEWLEKRVKGESKNKFNLGSIENKKRGQRKRMPILSTCAKQIIYNYYPWDIGNLSVNGLARKLFVSPDNLSKTFKKETGVNLENIVISQKMYVSATFLTKNPELTVKKITEIIDYYSVDYFIIVFKRFFGTTPGMFRNRYKTIISHINK